MPKQNYWFLKPYSKFSWILGRVQGGGNETLGTICFFLPFYTGQHKAHPALSSLEHSVHTLGHETRFPWKSSISQLVASSLISWSPCV